MGRLELFDELAKACGSTTLERQLDLYLERSIGKEKALESDIRKVCLNLADSIKETEAFAKECDVMKDTNDYIQQYIPRPPPLRPESSLVDAYLAKLEKKRNHAKLDVCELPSVSRSDSSVREPSLKDRVITELNTRVFKLESIIQVLHRERNGGVVAPLAFNDCFSNMTNDFRASLNNLYLDLVKLPESDEDIVLYIREEELRLRLEEEDRLQLEDEKMRKQEMRIRVDEYKRMRSEEEMVSHLAEEKKKKRNEFVNSAKLKKSLTLVAPNKRNHADGLPSESNYKVSWVKLKKTRGYINDPCMIERLKNVKPWKEDLSRWFHTNDTLWLNDEFDLFLSKPSKVNYKFPWSDDFIVNRNFWLRLVCLDPARKGWLTEEHIDLWVDYMWHVRPENCKWAMVSTYFVQLLLQNTMPLFYVDGRRFLCRLMKLKDIGVLPILIFFPAWSHSMIAGTHMTMNVVIGMSG
ncbi:hypothetical protein CTI12_AA574300 [Artemisia annua]|uniref:Phospholipase-like protein n=1 Tax=Artemisia annua TaxID=35608 RepID=A0A2U1KQZ9_ARTAN|nr:hypothetical protein CTI12_AA574300 [Artemisia annua]